MIAHFKIIEKKMHKKFKPKILLSESVGVNWKKETCTSCTYR